MQHNFSSIPSLNFYGTTVAMDSLKNATTKDQAIGERSLWQKITDYFNFSNHAQVIDALFDVVNPKDSDTFQRGMVKLSILAQSPHGDNKFQKELSLEVTQDGGNSVVRVLLGEQEIELVKVEFDGIFEPNNCFFEKDPNSLEVDGKTNYHLAKTDDFLIVDKFLKSHSNEAIEEKKQQEKERFAAQLKDVISDGSESGKTMLQTLRADVNRVTGFLPSVKGEGGGIITKNDYLERMVKIFSEELLVIDKEKWSIEFAKEKEIEIESELTNLSMEDNVFLWLVVCQSAKNPMEQFLLHTFKVCEALEVVSKGSPLLQPLATATFEFVGSSGDTEYKLRARSSNSLPSLSDPETKLIQLDYDSEITIRINSKQVEDVAVDFSNVKVNLSLTKTDGISSTNCPVLKTEPNEELREKLDLPDEWSDCSFSVYGDVPLTVV